MRDLAVYILLGAFPVTYFLLKAYGTEGFGEAVAFSVMLSIAFIGLTLAKVTGKRGELEPVPFDRDLSRFSLLYALALGLLALALTSAATGLLGQSALYVPRPGAVIAGVTPALTGILYQFTLVAPAEESLKAAGMYALYSRMEPGPYSELVSVSVPIALWAGFHAILNLAFTPLMFVMIFAGGLLFYAGLRLSGSILTPIISHGLYNSVIVALASTA